jgi:tRNA threonylcarbamoyladenosine biosynthesis protein TsaE
LIQEFLTTSEDETRKIGRWLGQQLQPGTVIGLSGTLGAGKTRFTQGIGWGLDVSADAIVSPTFTLCIPYAGRLKLLHLDAYRIKHPSEIDELGLDELVEDGGVLVIEWYERFAPFFPPRDIQVTIEWLDESQRKIEVDFLAGENKSSADENGLA